MEGTIDDPFAQAPRDSAAQAPRPLALPGPAAMTPQGTRTSRRIERPDHAVVVGLNPIVTLANPILTAVRELRTNDPTRDPFELRVRLIEELRHFTESARAAGIAQDKVLAARYVLCTLLDEVIGSTPWGAESGWSHRTLLVTFHNEAYGGEKTYHLLGRLADEPAANIDLLELIYVAMALGFSGLFRNDPARLDAWRERVATLIRNVRGEQQQELSPQWRGTTAARRSVLSALPLWMPALMTLALLIGLYGVLAGSLHRAAEPVSQQIAALRLEPARSTPLAATAATVAQSSPDRLRSSIHPELEGTVMLQEDASKSVLTLRGDALFASGATHVEPALGPVLERIASALKNTPGTIYVVGHSDNQPIAIRGRTNLSLSRERAKSVAFLLVEHGVPAQRLNMEGRGDTQPIASNATPHGRAQNRRVEITLVATAKE